MKGRDSILKNIPNCTIQKNKHLFLSLKSIIDIFLEFGYDSNYITTTHESN